MAICLAFPDFSMVCTGFVDGIVISGIQSDFLKLTKTFVSHVLQISLLIKLEGLGMVSSQATDMKEKISNP
jgi:hypothetical protein